VLPSVRTPQGDMDGIPVSLIEAMGIGVPVVSARLSGIPELVEHERSGLLIPPGDGRALAEAITRLARDPALAHVLAARGRARVRETFSLARYVDRLLGAWNEAAAAAAPAVEWRAR